MIGFVVGFILFLKLNLVLFKWSFFVGVDWGGYVRVDFKNVLFYVD